MLPGLLHNRKDQEMVKRMLIKWQIVSLVGLFPIDLHHVLHMEGQSGHNCILVLLYQLLSLGCLHLHRGPLLHTCIDFSSIREHVQFLVKGSDV